MRRLFEFFCWLMPATQVKNNVLRRLGHSIGATASIAPILVFGVERFELGERCRLMPFSLFRGLRLVQLDDIAAISSWNWIFAEPEYQALDNDAGSLYMESGSIIGARNALDCSGSIHIGEFANLGSRTYLQTQEVDVASGQMTAGRIVIGQRAVISSCSFVLKGSTVPPQSVLAANSTFTPASAPDLRRGLYAGAPATWKVDTQGDAFVRTEQTMSVHVVDGDLGPEEYDQAP